MASGREIPGNAGVEQGDAVQAVLVPHGERERDVGPDVVADQPVLRHVERGQRGLDARSDDVSVVALLWTIGVALSRQVDRDHVEALGKARHRLVPSPPGLRESGEQHDGGAAPPDRLRRREAGFLPRRPTGGRSPRGRAAAARGRGSGRESRPEQCRGRSRLEPNNTVWTVQSRMDGQGHDGLAQERVTHITAVNQVRALSLDDLSRVGVARVASNVLREVSEVGSKTGLSPADLLPRICRAASRRGSDTGAAHSSQQRRPHTPPTPPTKPCVAAAGQSRWSSCRGRCRRLEPQPEPG